VSVPASIADDGGFRVVAAGDSAIVIELADRLDPVVNQTAISLADAVRAAQIAGVRDVVSTYRSVAVYFDPLRTDYQGLVERVTREAGQTTAVEPGSPRPIRVPVCYGGELGPDLGAVAAFAGLSEAETVGLHASRTYRVFMLGFSPGFTYMGPVDERIAMPRLPVPRLQVQAGSVGIAGFQTGIYPASTPGGWRIVGRTPIRPFDLDRADPFMFRPGAAVQFYPVEIAEYASFEAPVR
jgi:KipI family sensor histidine kinase inhibitor